MRNGAKTMILKANLVRFKAGFPSSITKDKRGWLLNPITLALNSGVKGSYLSLCFSFLENHQIADQGYAEAIIDQDEVAVAASIRGTAPALVNIDMLESTFFIGCQDMTINHNSSSTDFNAWKDL
ncbi:hypothetical protein SLEP1_g53099 [Rubroshorea leprosula]|uniref:Uncharacterized protein n=1 Tax=Rubroshorea leprosula TaxID=152421 RepID=A0AAV5MBT8_9ROSI|nr:hypothetical protein SLEP1_g53099 [Rubroshorea leprosula]